LTLSPVTTTNAPFSWTALGAMLSRPVWGRRHGPKPDGPRKHERRHARVVAQGPNEEGRLLLVLLGAQGNIAWPVPCNLWSGVGLNLHNRAAPR
jgi:hypothetical protein